MSTGPTWRPAPMSWRPILWRPPRSTPGIRPLNAAYSESTVRPSASARDACQQYSRPQKRRGLSQVPWDPAPAFPPWTRSRGRPWRRISTNRPSPCWTHGVRCPPAGDLPGPAAGAPPPWPESSRPEDGLAQFHAGHGSRSPWSQVERCWWAPTSRRPLPSWRASTWRRWG